MEKLENIFLSKIGEEISAEEELSLEEGIDLLSIFDKYFEEGDLEAIDVLNSYEGILKFTPEQIQQNIKKLSLGLELGGKGILKVKNIFKEINNYKNSNLSIGKKMTLFFITMYLYGIQKKFTPQVAGTLFENFIAGLSGGKIVGQTGDFVDIEVAKTFWGIKFLGEGTAIEGSIKGFEKVTQDVGLVLGTKTNTTIEINIVEPAEFSKILKEYITEDKLQFKIPQSRLKSKGYEITIHTVDFLKFFQQDTLENIKNIIKHSNSIMTNLTTYIAMFKSGKNNSKLKDVATSIVDDSNELNFESKKLIQS